jgi:hypothetical protein
MGKYLDVGFPERWIQKNVISEYFWGHPIIIGDILAIFFDPLAMTHC